MTYIPNSYDIDPAMRYEGLARYAFDCDRWGGPDNVATQSAYGTLFMPNTTQKGLKVLNQILDALIEKTQDAKKIKEFRDIKNSITEKMSQMTAIELIDYLIKIIQS